MESSSTVLMSRLRTNTIALHLMLLSVLCASCSYLMDLSVMTIYPALDYIIK